MYVLCTLSKPTAAQMKGCSCSIALDLPCCTAHRTRAAWKVLCQLSWLLRYSHLRDAHRGPLICSPSKFRSVVASLSTTALPHFWVAPRLRLAGISSLPDPSHL